MTVEGPAGTVATCVQETRAFPNGPGPPVLDDRRPRDRCDLRRGRPPQRRGRGAHRGRLPGHGDGRRHRSGRPPRCPVGILVDRRAEGLADVLALSRSTTEGAPFEERSWSAAGGSRSAGPSRRPRLGPDLHLLRRGRAVLGLPRYPVPYVQVRGPRRRDDGRVAGHRRADPGGRLARGQRGPGRGRRRVRRRRDVDHPDAVRCRARVLASGRAARPPRRAASPAGR